MPEQNPSTSAEEAIARLDPGFVLDGSAHRGVVRHGPMVIGQYEDDTLVLDLGWCRMAGVTVRCLDDRIGGDNHRGGVAFERAPGDLV